MALSPAERANAAVAHYIRLRDERAPSDIDIEAGTNDAPWWLELRDAFDQAHDAWRDVVAEMQARLDQRAVDFGAFTQSSLSMTKALEARIHELEKFAPPEIEWFCMECGSPRRQRGVPVSCPKCGGTRWAQLVPAT